MTIKSYKFIVHVALVHVAMCQLAEQIQSGILSLERGFSDRSNVLENEIVDSDIWEGMEIPFPRLNAVNIQHAQVPVRAGTTYSFGGWWYWWWFSTFLCVITFSCGCCMFCVCCKVCKHKAKHIGQFFTPEVGDDGTSDGGMAIDHWPEHGIYSDRRYGTAYRRDYMHGPSFRYPENTMNFV